MPIIESPHTKQCWGIDARGLTDEHWFEFEALFPVPIKWWSTLWTCYVPKGQKPQNWVAHDGRMLKFFRIEEPPTPRGKKVTILPGAKGL